MANLLSANALEQLEGTYLLVAFVKFEIPGFIVGYHAGSRQYTLNGFTYQPNRFINLDGVVETLDDDIAERTVKFSNIPKGAGNLADEIQTLDYLGAPVVVSRVVFDPDTFEEKDLGETTFHEIYDVVIAEGERDENGQATSTISIVLRAPGYAGRNATNIYRSIEEHQANFDPTDTFYQGVDEVVTIQEAWGQRSG